jgi:magnesium transporter
MSETRFFHISTTGELFHISTLDEALEMAKKGGFIWLDYCQPSKEELTSLIEPLGLHPLAIEDCTDENQVPKIEDFPTNTFILFNAFSYSYGTLTIAEVDLFIGQNFLVTVSGRDVDQRRFLSGIERIVELDIENARQGPAFLLHVLLDHIVDQKFHVIEAIEEALDKAEEAMLDDISRFQPTELLRLRRDLLALRKSLFHEREILVKVCRKDCPFIPEKSIYFYRDIYDHLAKFFELTESSREIVTSLMEMYLSMLNNQMARAANETNFTVRRLTLITTIFMPLTLLAGIGGMSEWSMMTGPANWKTAYPLFLMAMILIAAANYYMIKWYERRHQDSNRPF